MKPFRSFLLSLAAGVLAAGIMGNFLTGETTARLLEKNKALIEAGMTALPGSGHLEVMAGSGPALAGALFFALSLGIGGAALSWLAGMATGRLPSHLAGLAAAPLFIPAFYALARGRTGTAAALALIAGIPLMLGFRSSKNVFPGKKETLASIAVVLILLAGFSVWRFSGVSPFVIIRDRALMGSEILRPASDFYYRWTLYPAEAIKPLDSITIPLVKADLEARGNFCQEARELGLLCAPPGLAFYDLEAADKDGAVELTYKGRSAKWRPGDRKFNRESLKTLADATDTARPLRRATYLSLMYGLPAAILLLAAFLISECVPSAKYRISLALAVALAVGWAGMPDERSVKYGKIASGEADPSKIAGMLVSAHPVERFYGVFAAGSDPVSHEAELIAALKDPVMNVRYQAATALGGCSSAGARESLLKVLAGDEGWYVKFRAYNSLLRTGWQP